MPPGAADGRTGRPPKRPGARPTRDRLIDAAIEVFAEHGFGGTTITDVAERAGISGPAVYKHFGGKADLLIKSARRSLDGVTGLTDDRAHDPVAIARLWLSPTFERTRRLLVELHVAAGRDDDLMDLLARWHRERTAAWQADRSDSAEQVKAFYLLLLGVSQVDSLASLPTDPSVLQEHVDRMVAALFPDLRDDTSR